MKTPPRLFDQILKWYCKQADLEDMQGDFYELYEDRLKKSKWYADRFFILDIAKLFNPFSKHRKRNTWFSEFYGFNFKNQIKVSSRNFRKHHTASFVQIFGLGVAIATCMFIFNYTSFENSFDNFHAKKDRIYRVVTTVTSPEFEDQTAWSQVFLKDLLEKESPDVQKVVRLLKAEKAVNVLIGNQSFSETNVFFSDSEISEIFTYPWLKGDTKSGLSSPNMVVLTQKLALKYFNSTDVLGKSISIGNQSYHVSGIMKDPPKNSDLQFDMLLPFSESEHEWSFVYLLLKNKASVSNISSNITDLVEGYNDYYTDENFNISYEFEPIEEVHFSTPKLYDTPKSNRSQVWFFQALGLVIMIIALVNFINLYTAQLVLRIDNINMQQVIGANKSQLYLQFLTENFLYFGLASILGTGMVFLFTNMLSKITGFSFFESTTWYDQFYFATCFLACITASATYAITLIGKASGIRRTQLSGIKTHFRKGLIGIQFALSFATIIATLVIYLQSNLIQNQDLGFSSNHVIKLEFPTRTINHSKATSLKNALQQSSSIQSISLIGSNSTPGMDADVDEFYVEGMELMQLYENISVDENFLSTLDISLLAGRFFSSTVKNEHNRSLVVNESFVKHMGWESADEALGKEIGYYHINGEIVGVTENFHFRSPHQLISPMVMIYDMGGPFALLKINENKDFISTINQIEIVWNQHFPEIPFSFSFLKSEYEKQYRHEQSTLYVVSTIATIVILLSIMGIYAILFMMGNYREKEMGIRKVNGAVDSDIFKLYAKEFFRIILMAQLIISPLAWLGLNRWLEHYPVRISLNPLWFLLIIGTLFLIVGMVIYIQTLRSMRSNTIDALKYE